MRGLETAAIITTGLWLSVLTLVVILLVRQIGLLTVKLDRVLGNTAPVHDGLIIGSDVPGEVEALIPTLDGELSYLLVLSAGCGPCRELAAELRDREVDARVIALVTGRDEAVEAIAELLPPRIEQLRDPDAEAVTKSFHIRTAPFAFQIEGRRITGKAALRGADDLLAFMEARNHPDAQEPSWNGNRR